MCMFWMTSRWMGSANVEVTVLLHGVKKTTLYGSRACQASTSPVAVMPTHVRAYQLSMRNYTEGNKYTTTCLQSLSLFLLPLI